MTTLRTRPATDQIDAPEVPVVPKLENGDRLDRFEYERRYAAMPELKNAQLVEGIVYMPSPISHRNHGNPHFNAICWLGAYVAATPGLEGGDNSTLRLDLDNAPQPDTYLIVLPTHGGQAQIDADGYIVGAPELVVEVSASSVSLDMNAKLGAYRRNGVREYVVWRVLERAIDWFVLRGGVFQLLALNAQGHYCSEILPGLWLDPNALINGDLARVSQVAALGTASPEHAAFKATLQQAAARLAGS